MEGITRERRWTQVAQKMGYDSGKGVGGTLKNHYERILFPFFLFKTGVSLEAAVSMINQINKYWDTLIRIIKHTDVSTAVIMRLVIIGVYKNI